MPDRIWRVVRRPKNSDEPFQAMYRKHYWKEATAKGECTRLQNLMDKWVTPDYTGYDYTVVAGTIEWGPTSPASRRDP